MLSQEVVSIIVPFYKAGQYAEQLIKSISSQTYSNFEVIIVDDGCGKDFDILIGFIKSHSIEKKVKLVSSFGNTGPSNARNVGLSMAIGSFIAFLDSDDEWSPLYLEQAIKKIYKEKAAIIATEIVWNSPDKKTRLYLPPILTFNILIQTSPIQPTSVIINKSLVGYFEFPECKHEDYALWLKLLKQGHIINCLNEPLVFINRVQDSVSSNKSKASKWHWNVMSKNVDKTKFSKYLLFIIYALNGVLKRKLKNYKPIFLKESFIKILP